MNYYARKKSILNPVSFQSLASTVNCLVLRLVQTLIEGYSGISAQVAKSEVKVILVIFLSSILFWN